VLSSPFTIRFMLWSPMITAEDVVFI
jgi:hypothetical protein